MTEEKNQPQQRPAGRRPVPHHRPLTQRRPPHQSMQQTPNKEPVLNVRPSNRTEILTGPQQITAPEGTPPLKVYALGGLEEIGRNCTVLECGDDIVLVDCGLMFPEEGMPGIDYIIPNISSLRGRRSEERRV